MTTPRFSSFLSAAVLLHAALSTASAHQMWIEPLTTATPQLSVRFGEFGDSVEKSPGYLDALAPVVAWLPPAAGKDAEPLAVTKQSDHFLVPATGADAFAFTNFPVMGKEGAPGKLPLFYLRWHAAGPAKAAESLLPAHILDLVPEGAGVVRVFFRNEPMAGAAVTLMSPGGVESSLTANKEGRITLPAPVPGLTLLTVNQKETLAGTHLGKTYTTTSHNASLSWITPP